MSNIHDVNIIGLDPLGNPKKVSVDSGGNLKLVTAVSPSNLPVQVCFDAAHTAVNNSEWQHAATYIIPAGYNLHCILFGAKSPILNEAARICSEKNLGSFVGSTNVFTDGSLYTLPTFGAKIHAFVTTVIGNVNDTITITYTNDKGIAGRTATVVIPRISKVGTSIEIPLQSNDLGVVDITNITHSQTGQAGNFEIHGFNEIFFLMLTAANTLYQTPALALGSVVLFSGETIHLQYLPNSGVSQMRRISLTGTLVPSS
jgi:hypothetical protein